MGVKNIAVAINKMDAVNYEEEKYNKVKEDVGKLLQGVGFNIRGTYKDYDKNLYDGGELCVIAVGKD